MKKTITMNKSLLTFSVAILAIFIGSSSVKITQSVHSLTKTSGSGVSGNSGGCTGCHGKAVTGGE